MDPVIEVYSSDTTSGIKQSGDPTGHKPPNRQRRPGCSGDAGSSCAWTRPWPAGSAARSPAPPRTRTQTPLPRWSAGTIQPLLHRGHPSGVHRLLNRIQRRTGTGSGCLECISSDNSDSWQHRLRCCATTTTRVCSRRVPSLTRGEGCVMTL